MWGTVSWPGYSGSGACCTPPAGASASRTPALQCSVTGASLHAIHLHDTLQLLAHLLGPGDQLSVVCLQVLPGRHDGGQEGGACLSLCHPLAPTVLGIAPVLQGPPLLFQLDHLVLVTRMMMFLLRFVTSSLGTPCNLLLSSLTLRSTSCLDQRTSVEED